MTSIPPVASRAASPSVPAPVATPVAPGASFEPRSPSRGLRIKKILTFALLAAVVGLLAWNARHVDWDGVWTALRAYDVSTLAGAAALTIVSFAVYSCFDLLARRYTRPFMSVGSVMSVTFVSHALGLNLGVAGVALRFRLYGAYGVDAASVAKIWGLSVMTNWMGFMILGGIIFAGGYIDLPATSMPKAPIGAATLSSVGVALLAGCAAYLVICVLARGRSVTLFSRTLTVPSAAFGAWQFLLSAANWTLIAGVLYVLLRGSVDFPTVLGVYLLSAIALSVVDVPGGLGITEAVFIALLGQRMPLSELLAALVVYRAVFYLAPLAPAVVSYLAIEARRHAEGRRR